MAHLYSVPVPRLGQGHVSSLFSSLLIISVDQSDPSESENREHQRPTVLQPDQVIEDFVIVSVTSVTEEPCWLEIKDNPPLAA